MTDFDFDPSIDPGNLDKEWLTQPRLYYQWAAMAAEARREHEEARRAVDVARADAAMTIRSDPAAYGIEKVTEAQIAAAVELAQDVRDAEQDAINLRHRVDVVGAAVAALDHRKRALENLVELFLANYYAEPRAREAATNAALAEPAKQQARRRAQQPAPAARRSHQRANTDKQ